jgi:pyruvate-ferredoxin/flavodoxin oxidoreductase
MPTSVVTAEGILDAAVALATARGASLPRARQLIPNLARQLGKELSRGSMTDAIRRAADPVLAKLATDDERRTELDQHVNEICASLDGYPFIQARRFLEGGNGQPGLLAIGIRPDACTGCMLCAAVCPEQAISGCDADTALDRMESEWKIWRSFPPTPQGFLPGETEGIGADNASHLFLRPAVYDCTRGGDGMCPGCGERTVLRLVLGSISAAMAPRVQQFVRQLDELIEGLETRCRSFVASSVSLERIPDRGDVGLPLDLEPDARRALDRSRELLGRLRDLKWRYEAGPSDRGRAPVVAVNDTGTDSVRSGVFPYNPYPIPWTNELHGAPAVAAGYLDAQLRAMGREFATVRLAERELAGEMEQLGEDDFALDPASFTQEERLLCPPVIALGDATWSRAGALLDALQQGSPVRLVVLDRCETPGLLAPVVESALRLPNTFVVQSSQADAAHLVTGMMRAATHDGPCLAVLHAPCPTHLGTDDDSAYALATRARDTRLFPHLISDPTAHPDASEQIDLSANPDPSQRWVHASTPGGDGSTALTPANWCAEVPRLAEWTTPVDPATPDEHLVQIEEFLDLDAQDRDGVIPVAHGRNAGEAALVRLSDRAVNLCVRTEAHWANLLHMAGREVVPSARRRLQHEFEAQVAAVRKEFEETLRAGRAQYARVVAHRMAEGLLRAGNGDQTLRELLAKIDTMGSLEPIELPDAAPSSARVQPAVSPAETAPAVVAAPAPAPAPAPATAPAADDEPVLEAYIDSELCTACNECININKKMFAYNKIKQAYIVDPAAGTFKQLVMAAEKCPVAIIHPGAPTPRNSSEPDLEKWVARAEPFN